MSTMKFAVVLLGVLAGVCRAEEPAAGDTYPPAMRPMPTASNRPKADGPALFVDAVKGSDQAPGTEQAPFKTIARAARELKPGHTLYLRGGTYYEQLNLTLQGEKDRPITLRSYPGELAILDGGLREFVETPDTAWVPYPEGAPNEFRSAKTYEAQGETRELNIPGAVNVQGYFADTMVPLHGYWSTGDLRSSNELWVLDRKAEKETIKATGKVAASTTKPAEEADDNDEEEEKTPDSIWCGPGILYDPLTKYIHIRLAHTFNQGVGEANYHGSTDPRLLKLVISRPGRGGVLRLDESSFVNLQDLVIRGSRGSTIQLEDCQDLNFDGLTVYAGTNCLNAIYTRRLHVNRCAFRGIAAPWTFRSSLKYRSIEGRLIAVSGWMPAGNADFEFENSEFTDSVDGIFIGNVQNVKFHHNYVNNLSDDCFFLTATTGYDGKTLGGNIHIYQNYISRCLTTLAFGVGHGRQKLTEKGRQLGAGVWFYRNVVDNREWVPYLQHKSAEEYEYEPKGRMSGDHGSPTWEPMYIYHNTIIAGQDAFRDYYLNGLSAASREHNPRRLFNNISVQLRRMPGMVFPEATADLKTATNLHWDVAEGATFEGNPFGKFRGGRIFKESVVRHPPGWTVTDLFADPKFVRLDGEVSEPADLRLQPASPAVDAGSPIPSEWPDPLRGADAGKPDLGAIPAGAEPWQVGLRPENKISGVRK